MATTYRKSREKTVAPFVADADPRTTAPAAQSIFHLQDRVVGQSEDEATRGHALYVRFLDVAGAEVIGPTVDFTTWVYDAGSGSWTSLASEAAAPGGAVYQASAVGDIFVQLTAVGAVGAATKAEIWITERVAV